MSIKLGIGLAAWPFPDPDPELFFDYVERAEAAGVDSLWLSERLTSPAPMLEPLSALAMAAARTRSMKFGMSVLVLPARNPVILARTLATIDFLSGGRMLPAFGLGLEDPREQEAAGVPRAERAARVDEATRLLRRLWSEDEVTHHGRFYNVTSATVRPHPKQAALPVWFGGRSDAALRRVGTLGDGWLGSAVTPVEAAEMVPRIQAHAAAAGRAIDDDHYGVIVPYWITGDRDAALERVAPAMLRLRPDASPAGYAALGSAADCRDLVRRYVDAGVSKFVMRPVCPPAEIFAQLEQLTDEVLPAFHDAGERTPRPVSAAPGSATPLAGTGSPAGR
jgi:probable F420-dependent oxidoreductase